MHWFNPPALIPLIEIIRNDATRDDVAQAVFDLSLAIGKKPALVQRTCPALPPTASSSPCCARPATS